ncbi:SWIM zinc finger family protein [Streptomyces sp. NPDC012466]|uniref:SWIM zinc finger family protein n=1 Tax=Streptomyces sp. NPDC012466 TaxID=3364835 RepID=UPI0036E4E399
MTPSPADEARRALREARERAARETGPAPAARPGPPPAGGAAAQGTPGPADVAREALRRAVSVRDDVSDDVPDVPESDIAGREEDDCGAEATSAREADHGLESTSAPDLAGASESAGASGTAGAPGTADAGEALGAPHDAGAPDDTPAPDTPEPQASGDPRTNPAGAAPADAAPARPSARAGAEPRAADVAREALRAARDDARRAREETEREGARRRRRARQSAVDDRAAAARRAGADAPAARDVRQLLSDAFRMPNPQDAPTDDHERTTGQGSGPARTADLLHGSAGRSPERPHSGYGQEEPYGGYDEAAPGPVGPHSESGPAAPGPVTPGRAGSPGTGSEASAATAGTGTPASPPPDPAAHPDGPATPLPPSAPAYARPGHPAPASSPTAHSTQLSTPRSDSVSRTPRSPRSMADPSRDSELRRTFPPFPPRAGERFAESWWGNAWVSALEQGALDVKRLERGRGYAGQGHVDAITVTPGMVLAYVQGSRPRPYRVQVRLRTLDDTDWDRFLDTAADRPGHIAALLDKEMPQSLADCGVPLLPGPGDLEPRCSCPDRGHPCKHAAALCYQTARLLDADPFVLLLLRGRGERELLDALSRLSATRAARAAQDRGPAPLPGVRAAEVLASRALPPLPAPLPPPAHPEQPPAYPAAPGGPDPFALDQLATDAAVRAHALLHTGRDPVGELTFWQDAVRLAAARPGSGLTAGSRALYSSLASAAGRTPSELARAVAAWRQGGLEGLAVLEEPWDPPAGRFDRARPLLLAADLPAFRPWRNHLTHPQGHVQLRLGRDGLWYAYESEPGHDDWWPRGTPDLDPVGALTGLGLPSDL